MLHLHRDMLKHSGRCWRVLLHSYIIVNTQLYEFEDDAFDA